MPARPGWWLLALLCLWLSSLSLFGQPAGNSGQAGSDSVSERFKKLHAEWTALDKQLSDLQDRYEKGTAGVRAELKKQYEELVARSTQLLDRLREAAVAAYSAAPNQDPAVLRTLIGMAAYDYRRDDYESALQIAKLLAEHQCTEPVLYSVAGAAAFSADDYETAEKYLTTASKIGQLDEQGKGLLTSLPQQKQAWEKEQGIRSKEMEANDLPRVKLETTKGTIVIELFENEAPQAVGNFISLVEQKFYDALAFHRVLPGFMAQGGDPQGDGSGGPGYHIACECYQPNARQHFRGSLSMAHAGRDTGGSQFFLTFRPTTHLNGKHTVFGRVIEGLDVLAKLQRRDPTRLGQPAPDRIVKAEVIRKRDHKYEPTKVAK